MKELARLFHAYAAATALESVTLKAAMTLCALVLQKPSQTSDHVACIERRMASWSAGKLDELVQEGETIQKRLISGKQRGRSDEEKVRKAFNAHIMKGDIKAALHVLSYENRGSPLS